MCKTTKKNFQKSPFLGLIICCKQQRIRNLRNLSSSTCNIDHQNLAAIAHLINSLYNAVNLKYISIDSY